MKGLLITTLVSLAISQSLAATECPAVDGPLPVYIPNPADCGTYYQCVGGKPLLLQCPVGTHWSTIMNRCDFPENAKCEETGAKPTSIPTEAPVSEDPPKKPDGCPAENDQEWSVELSRCDWPEIAKCSESGNESNETTVEPETDPEDPPNTPDGCPAENGQEWSVELSRCDWPEIAKCSESENESNEISVEPETDPEDPPKKPDGCPAENGPEDDNVFSPEALDSLK
ncbi:hypothetical protein CBL_14552 [Carabus blaptoides fortunei]